MRATALFILLAVAPATAAEWTPAPVPNVIPTDTVTPAARAGESNGPQHDAPLSGQPVGTDSTGGTVSTNGTFGVGSPSVER